MSRFLFAFILLVWSCSPSDDPAAAGVVVRDSAGVRIVESRTPEWGGERTLESSPIVQVGSLEGEGPTTFALIADAKFAGPGVIAVTDSRADDVRFFDMSGAPMGIFGGPGEGPNEFGDVGHVYRYPGDSVAAFDFGLSRTLVFPINGGDARAVSALVDGSRAPVLVALEDGSFLAYRRIPIDLSTVQGPVWDTTSVVLIDRSGGGWREVQRLPAGPARGTPREVLAAHSLLVGQPDGFFWMRTDAYEIHDYDSLGHLRSLIRRPVTPQPLSFDDHREYASATVASLRAEGREESARRLERTFLESDFATVRPLFWTGFVDADGRLWVSHWPWPARYASPDKWTVFGPDGRWLGDVQTRDGVMIQDAVGDTVLVQWRDEYDVPYLRLYRLSEPS